jgi:hypothetical protein
MREINSTSRTVSIYSRCFDYRSLNCRPNLSHRRGGPGEKRLCAAPIDRNAAVGVECAVPVVGV